VHVDFDHRYRDEVFTEARAWLGTLVDDHGAASGHRG